MAEENETVDTGTQTPPEPKPDDIHASIREAFKEHEAPADTPEPKEAKPEPKTAQEPATGPVRGPDGKFAPKTQDAPATASVGDQGGGEARTDTATVSATRPPPGWSIEAKAAFNALPEPVKAAIARREEEVSNGFKQYADRTKGYEPLDEVLKPWQDRFRAEGVTTAQAVDRLLNAQRLLETRPAEAIQYFARTYGVDLRQLVGGQNPTQPGSQQSAIPGVPPQLGAVLNPIVQQALQNALAPWAQKVQSLETSLSERDKAAEAHQKAAVLSQIEAFAQDPANLYFENVQSRMAVLIEKGEAKDLKDAYEQAIWSHPEIRQRLISETQAKNLQQQSAQRASAVQQAKAAGGSITGAPATAGNGRAATSSTDLHSMLKDAFAESAGRA